MSDLWLVFLYKGFALVLVHVVDTALDIDDTLKQTGNTAQIQDQTQAQQHKKAS